MAVSINFKGVKLVHPTATVNDLKDHINSFTFTVLGRECIESSAFLELGYKRNHADNTTHGVEANAVLGHSYDGSLAVTICSTVKGAYFSGSVKSFKESMEGSK